MIDYISIPQERMKLLKTGRRWEQQFKKLSDVKVVLNEEIEISDDDPIAVMSAKMVFQAFGRGFDFDTSLNLLDEEFTLKVIDISIYAKSRNRMITLKGRVIGTEGKAKNIIENETETKIAIYGKTISIIGRFQNVDKARDAIELLLSGRKHGTAFRFLG